MRKCPYCKSTVSPWSVIKPGLWKDTRIKCKACGKEISEYWAQTNIFAWIILGILSVVFTNLLDDAWYLELLYLFLFICVLLVLTYLFIPLKRIGEE
jgi:antibiotic biosynthesis monooxygenase (ABM) superfamily enzyme